jgi:hypothetical protein
LCLFLHWLHTSYTRTKCKNLCRLKENFQEESAADEHPAQSTPPITDKVAEHIKNTFFIRPSFAWHTNNMTEKAPTDIPISHLADIEQKTITPWDVDEQNLSHFPKGNYVIDYQVFHTKSTDESQAIEFIQPLTEWLTMPVVLTWDDGQTITREVELSIEKDRDSEKSTIIRLRLKPFERQKLLSFQVSQTDAIVKLVWQLYHSHKDAAAVVHLHAFVQTISDDTAEGFSVGGDDRRAEIRKAYGDLLKREPQPMELLTAHNIYKNNSWNIESVEQYIKFTDEYRELTKNTMSGEGGKTDPSDDARKAAESLQRADTLNENQEHKQSLNKQLQMYRMIINAYENILTRLPTNDELDRFHMIMVQDSSFDLTKLRKNLMASSEYKRLQALQTNKVHAELPGNVTDAQLELNITYVYQSVYPGMRPTKDMMAFLKAKYVGYNLSDPKLKRLLLLLRDLDESNKGSGKSTSPIGWMSGSMRVDEAAYDSAEFDKPQTDDWNLSMDDINKVLNLTSRTNDKMTADIKQKQEFDPEICSDFMKALGSNKPNEADNMQPTDKRNTPMCVQKYYEMKNNQNVGYYGPGTANNENKGG